jgi:CubicO group peptidase (beta-lactamase class C family)
VYHEAFGVANARAPSKELRRDSIVWVASMTKPLVATAVLMMVEEGRLGLEDPPSRFIREFRERRSVRLFEPGVFESARGRAAHYKPHGLASAQRDITIKDLLTHTSGLQSVGIPNAAIPPIGSADSVADWVSKLGGVPLDFEPGTRWAYSNVVAFEVLVCLIEIASGQPFEEFLRRRLFEPLGMKDSGFGMQRHRPEQAIPVDREVAENPCVLGTTYHSGAGGLWTTATDYWRFAQMLANGGTFNGNRLLDAESVARMSSDQTNGLFPGWRGIDGSGAQMGFSVLVVRDPSAAGVAVPAGSFGWDGVGKHRFWVIPKERTVIVMLLPGGDAVPVHRTIEKVVIEAIAH